MSIEVKCGCRLKKKKTWLECKYHYIDRLTFLGGGMELGFFFIVRLLLGLYCRITVGTTVFLTSLKLFDS